MGSGGQFCGNVLAQMLSASYGGNDMPDATLEQLREIFGLFRAYPAIFPHIRQDALSRRITAGQCVYEDGVVITYQRYKSARGSAMSRCPRCHHAPPDCELKAVQWGGWPRSKNSVPRWSGRETCT